MPEYLAPGVYIEEIEIGAKPIEGVSTTTTGFLGMAERGPLNKPTLVTSFAEYQRIFGGYLAEKVYGNKRGLPYAVEGFFVNGGQRLYVSRVATEKAAKSSGFLPDISGKSISLAEEVKANAITLKVKEDATDLKKDDVLLLKDGPQSEYLKFVSTAKALTLDVPLSQSYALNTDITKMNQGTTAYTIREGMAANAVVIKLDNVTDLGENDVLIINDDTNPEICIVKSVDTTEKSIEVKTPLRFTHGSAVEIKKLTTPATTKKLISVVKASYTVIPITATDTDFSPSDAIKIEDEYFIIKAAEADKVILIADELKHPHKMDKEIKQLVPAIEVKAVNEGTWGDKIKIVVKESTPSSAKLAADALNQNFLDLDTVTGMEKGTLLKLPTTPLSYETVTEVIKTDDTKRVVLENAVGSLSAGKEVSTVEFDIIVSFDGFDEAFKKLSMNEAHSRYVEEIITPESSKLISVKDVSTTVEAPQKIPMPSQDKEPGWKLSGGIDGIPDDSELDTTYEGKDDTEPVKRTGLYTLKNIDEISIVAIPGVTTQHLQNKLVIHCENMKDRFAVLDSEEKADLDAIQRQGNLYDSKYAALYYPWIRIFDPLSKKRINVSPSGYMCGIYARSDSERGVHKAPANEVVRGALGLEEFDGVKTIITKGQQDILNPKGINCIRAFPGRGIRVWGARTISSDSLWKYINVRRLFLFLEESIDEGTQWVVFEPNDEKLWARVRQTITQFLTRVWKDGALMGTTPEEAFFVKCDRTTMTQDDIDNGRLIVLIGVAPVKPAEFVIFRIAQWAGGSAVTE
jgi:phage tail sheath protein FI